MSGILRILNRFNFNSKQYKTKNFKGVLSLLAGNTVSKIVLILSGLILVKYYGPENYGVYTVFLSYIVILPALSNLELNNIAIMQRDSKNVRNVFSAALLASLCIITLLVGLVFLLKKTGIVQLELSEPLLILCGIGGILTGWNLSQNALFTKYKLFRQMSASLIIASVFSVVFQGIFYLMDWKENGLIYGWLIGLSAAFLYNFRVSKERWDKVNFAALKISVRENINIVKYAYASTALNTLANNILPILILIYFTKLEVGVYAMAIKVLATPLDLLSKSVSKVFFQKAVSLYHHDKNSLNKLSKKVSFTGFFLVLGYVILINTLGIYLLEFIFEGDEWIGLRTYILILTLWILARSFINPISEIMVVINRNQYSLIFNVYLFVINLTAIYFGVLYDSFIVCLYIFSIFSSLGYFIQWLAVMWDLKKLAENEG
ncbi:MAG: oligosaccharide flippase family protein [Weeksellaceae bacterium]